ncbi:MAG TPA: FtsX-like permease family protein [Sphingomicrobium sp.]|jgi:cell division transport system permease protein|nr:FtsX-like permease family protein [Sphingomicrobium sp.]
MLGWLTAPAPERRLLSEGRLRGPTLYVIAIMTFAMVVVAAAGLGLSNAAGIVARGVESRFVIQAEDSSSLPKVLQVVRSVPGVRTAEPVPEAEMRKTLERWLGPGGLSDDLPVPALVNVDLAPGTDSGAVGRRVEQASPGVRFVAHGQVVRPLLKSLRVLQWLALALVALMAVATSAVVVLAARGAFDTHRSTIDIMHGLGATDQQVTNLFQRKIAVDAFLGALAGGIAAALALIVLGGSASALAGDLAGGPPLTAGDLVILALLPIGAVVLAALVARAAVLSALRQSL